ncbi:MAG TPA: glycogen/starch/alpha-glucan phosphorylase [Verrucomicrobiae bacterium]|nr:glycogen/starch/alpha-glucan phosphorylase [Verrucomicrobiae bacterium]
MSNGRPEQYTGSVSRKHGHAALTVSALQDAIRYHVRYSLGKRWESCSGRELFTAVAFTVRDSLIDRMLDTEDRYQLADPKRVHYLSMEYLPGRSLKNNLSNLGMLDLCRDALHKMGVNLDQVLEGECEAGLGNGGLGRLAACFLDSLATMSMPAYGYGINYEYGLFKQDIDNGYQKEKPDNWLTHGSPWQIEHPDEACIVPLYGRIEHGIDRTGQYNPMWMDWKMIIGVPHDMPIVGFGGQTVNVLRLYSAQSSEEFDIQIFNDGDYLKAVEQQISSETISKVLYPSDLVEAGRELRLIQEYLLVACTLRDIVRRYEKSHATFDQFASKVAIHLNDTHPALAVAELMRILVDEHAQPWEKAWETTQAALSYTNHTLMPEALEKWSVSLFEYVLPRHLQIIYEINRRFLTQVASMWPGEHERLRHMSLIEEGEHKAVRMVNLAIVGSHATNGVSDLHTHMVKTSLVPDFYQLWPDKFSTKTNGITPRRWLLQANPLLADLITSTIGNGWITDLGKLRALEPYAQDPDFQQAFIKVKRSSKAILTRVIHDRCRVAVNPDALFDVHVKRIHEYKRQLLNVMQIIHQYLRMTQDGTIPPVPRVYIFAGKAAPGYWAAKQLIKLITSVGQVINNDPRVQGLIKVVFIPDYRVSLAEQIVPAADVSEQISMAGTEASGTGNMKFAMNGALTIGTHDGATIEIMEEVGQENTFLFGLQVEEIRKMRERGSYHPRSYYQRNPNIRRLMDTFASDLFCPNQPGLFRWIYESVLDRGDPYFHLADLESYIETQELVAQAFKDPAVWACKAILNVARMGKFSSDRAIAEYAREIWNIKPIL